MPADPRMPRPSKAQDKLTIGELNQLLDAFSDRISTQLRAVNFGVLGIAWLLLLKADEVASIAAKIDERLLLAIAALSILALLVDLIQNLLSEHAVEDAFARATQARTRTAAFREDSWAYRGQLFSYRLKLVLSLLAVVSLLVFMCCALLS